MALPSTVSGDGATPSAAEIGSCMVVSKALALAEQGFFVFPLLPGKKTPGLGMHFKDQATRDPDQVTRLFQGGDWNIGIYTGKFGDGQALLVVDVDNKGEKRGDDEVLRLELEGFDLPRTFTVATPTGGRHLFYRVGAPVRQGANVLGRGVDVRSRGGYVVGVGSETADGAYTVLDAAAVTPAPAWLVERCGKSRERPDGPAAREPLAAPSAESRAVHYLTNDAPAGEAGGRNDTGFKVAARVKDLGADEAACRALMAEHWKCAPPLDDAELAHVVHSAYRYGGSAQGSAAPEADFQPVYAVPQDMTEAKSTALPIPSPAGLHPFDKLNACYAFCVAGGGSHILFETTDHTGVYKLEHLASGTFHQKHAAETIQVGKKSSPVTEEWMRWKGRRSYDGLVFMPAREAPTRFYNLWRGFAVEPITLPPGAKVGVKGGAVQSWLDHVEANVCGGDKVLARWLVGFFAHMIQRPWEKPLVALVFRGGKGVGKNAVVKSVGSLLGGHALLTSNRRYLVGNFNGHLENLLLFTLDEAFWSGDKQAEGQLKDLITGDHHVIEHKGKEPYTVANLTRVCVIGNEDWLVPASHDERRFAVFDVGDGRKQDRAFFQSMREGLEAGGYRLLLRYLLDFDLGGLDFNGAPSTQGLADQKHASLEAFPGWWLTCLHDGKLVGGDFETAWPAEVDKERFRSAYRRYAKDRNVRTWLIDDRTMGRELKKFAPSVQPGRLHTGYTYRLPSLEQARAEWSTFIGHKVAWE